MKLNKLVSALGLAMGLAAVAAPATAYVHYSFEDDDIDFVLDANGNLVTSGPLEVGYTLVSIFEIPIFRKDNVDSIPAGKELVGVAAVTLDHVIEVSGGIGTTYYFRTPDIRIDSLLGYAGPTLPDYATIAMFFNGAPGSGIDRDLEVNRAANPASNCTSLADCVEQATLGTLYQVDGLLPYSHPKYGTDPNRDPDEFWSAVQTVPSNVPRVPIEKVLNTNNNWLIAGVNAALSNLYQADGDVHYINLSDGTYCGNPGRVADGCAQFSLSVTLTGGQGLGNGAVAHSGFDGQKYVPEPATLGLLGLGLLGLGLMRRRQG